MLGSYKINVHVGSNLPQRVASAFTRIFGSMVGASYEPIAYLGSKLVAGTNHAILATQTLITGQDVHNVVLIVLNEKPGNVDPTGENIELVGISHVLSDGGLLGGLQVAPTTEIPPEAMEVFTKSFQGILGGKFKPFALLATQMVNGIKYVFATEAVAVVSPNAIQSSNTAQICLVTVYSNYSKVEFDTIIEGKPTEEEESNEGSTPKLGYAFTWAVKDSVWP